MNNDEDRINSLVGDINDLVKKDVMARGKELMARDKEIFGTVEARVAARVLAQNFIYGLAKVNYPNNPISMQTSVAAELMALAITMISTRATTEILAIAVQEIGILSRTVNGVVPPHSSQENGEKTASSRG